MNLNKTSRPAASPVQSLWMLFAAFVFSIMGVCVKLASSMYSTSEIVMYRGAIGVAFTYAYLRFHGGTLKTAYPWHHLRRGLIGVLSMWLWFYALGQLPLATVMTLNYMSPIWIAAMLFAGGWWMGKTRFEWSLAVAIILSFAGVIMLLRPSIHADQWLGGIIALISGMVAAVAYLQVRHLGQLGEPEYRIVFYLSAMGMIVGFLGSLFNKNLPIDAAFVWHAHSPKGIVVLLAMGITATVAQMAMTRAYRLGKTLVTANLQYTGIIFSSVWGILIWNDILGWLGWFGIGIILFSGIVATVYNTRKLKTENASNSKSSTVADPISTEL